MELLAPELDSDDPLPGLTVRLWELVAPVVVPADAIAPLPPTRLPPAEPCPFAGVKLAQSPTIASRFPVLPGSPSQKSLLGLVMTVESGLDSRRVESSVPLALPLLLTPIV